MGGWDLGKEKEREKERFLIYLLFFFVFVERIGLDFSGWVWFSLVVRLLCFTHFTYKGIQLSVDISIYSLLSPCPLHLHCIKKVIPYLYICTFFSSVRHWHHLLFLFLFLSLVLFLSLSLSFSFFPLRI